MQVTDFLCFDSAMKHMTLFFDLFSQSALIFYLTAYFCLL